MRGSVLDEHPVVYLTPYRPSFWDWEEGSIALTNGPTLTFREELLTVARHLQPLGLPPLESLLLFLAALRDPWSEAGGLETAWRQSLRVYDRDLLERRLPRDWEAKILRELRALRSLEERWRRDNRRKCLLAEVCFERCRRRSSPRQAQGVVDLLEIGFVAPPGPPEMEADEAARRFALGLRPLLEGLPPLREDALEVRLRTGLDALPSAGKAVEMSLAKQVRSLLAELEADAEWGGLARLARQLMGAVHVPRALGEPEDLPMGGFSDLANRGSLDRLLLSELAQDDLVFSARLALNEALYLRRESPPKRPQESRLVLLDNGLQLWGLPRLYAAAVALAMEATADPHTQVEAFVPGPHQTLQHVCLHTREGLLEALHHLHPHAHPGNALLELARRAGEHEGHRELILITGEGVLEDPAFHSVAALLDVPFYVATVSRHGAYAFYRLRQNRRKLLSRAQLQLESVLQDDEDRERLRQKGVPEHLPALFRLRPFPIRLPLSSLRHRTLFTRGDGIYKTSRDGRLLHFDDPDRGGVQICENLPPGKPIPVVEVQPMADDRRVIAFISGGWLRISLVHPVSGALESFEIPARGIPLKILLVFQQLLVVNPRRITLHGIGGSEQLAEIELPKRVERCYGDLILTGSEWYRVSLDGMRPRLESVDRECVLKSSRLEAHPFREVGGLRRRFRGIAHDRTRLVLFPVRSGLPLTFKLHPESGFLQLEKTGTAVEPRLFRPVAAPPGSRVSLEEAAWPDGSRAILDSRGLLHLVSSASVPGEFSLILGAQRISAWLGEFGGAGDPYFFTEPPSATPQLVYRMIEQFVLNLGKA